MRGTCPGRALAGGRSRARSSKCMVGCWSRDQPDMSKLIASPKVLVVDLSNNYGGASSRVLSLMARAKPGTIALAGLKSGAITRQALQLGLPVHILAAYKADPRLLFR